MSKGKNSSPKVIFLEFCKVVKQRGNQIGVKPSEDDGDGYHKYLERKVKVLPEFDYFQIAIDDGRENDEHEGCLHEQIIHKKLHCFVGKIILLFNDEGLVH